MAGFNVYEMPAMKPPPGEVPNFAHPPSENTMALAVISVCFAVAAIAVLLRCYSKLVTMRQFHLSDYLLLAAFAFYTAICVIYIRLASNPGWFVHMWHLRMKDMIEFLRIGIITTCLLLSLMMLIKAAILAEWVRIFLPHGSTQRSVFFWTCHVMIWANVVYCSVTIILVNVACVPHSYLWDRTIPGGYCRINTAYTSLSAACFAFATDVIILFIPQRVIWQLNMSRSRKWGISVVFAIGAGACATSIVRLYNTVERSQSKDLTYELSTVQLTAVGESVCVILVMCAPTIPKAVKELGQTRFVSSIPSWTTHLLVTTRLRRPSHQSWENKHNVHSPANNNALSAAAASLEPSPPASLEKQHRIYSPVGSDSERPLAPLQPLPRVKTRDLESGDTVILSTRASADPYEDVPEKRRQRQWGQR